MWSLWEEQWDRGPTPSHSPSPGFCKEVWVKAEARSRYNLTVLVQLWPRLSLSELQALLCG